MVTDKEYLDVIDEIEAQNKKLQNDNLTLQNNIASSNFGGGEDTNSIKFQLESQTILDDLEHLFRGDIKTIDREGNEFWAKQEKEELVLLNDLGISYILSVLAPYIDKSTPLSYFADEERIYEILADLGDKLADDVYCTYEKIGLDTEYKRVRYGLLVMTLLNKVEVVYRRALRGQTSKDINTSQIYSEVGGRISRPMPQMNMGVKKRSLNPLSWFG